MLSNPPNPESPEGVLSVAVAFRIIDVVGAVDHPLGVTDIARHMNEQKARIQRHLVTLRSLGVLIQDSAGKYRLGWKLVELGHKAIAEFNLIELAERDVKSLRDQTSLTSALALVSGRGLRIAYVAESAAMMAVTVRPGLAVPVQGSSAGRLLVAYGPASEVPPEDAERMEAIRRRGFEYSPGENSSGIHSIAAPILDPGGHLVAALVCAGTHKQITDPPAPSLVDSVQQFARKIQDKLHQQPG